MFYKNYLEKNNLYKFIYRKHINFSFNEKMIIFDFIRKDLLKIFYLLWRNYFIRKIFYSIKKSYFYVVKMIWEFIQRTKKKMILLKKGFFNFIINKSLYFYLKKTIFATKNRSLYFYLKKKRSDFCIFILGNFFLLY